MNEIQFSEALRNTPSFKTFEKFKQGLTLKKQNISRLFVYYTQAIRYGIEYLKQNPNLYSNDIKMIEEVINREQ